jgi:hypothetical protein
MLLADRSKAAAGFFGLQPPETLSGSTRARKLRAHAWISSNSLTLRPCASREDLRVNRQHHSPLLSALVQQNICRSSRQQSIQRTTSLQGAHGCGHINCS